MFKESVNNDHVVNQVGGGLGGGEGKENRKPEHPRGYQ